MESLASMFGSLSAGGDDKSELVERLEILTNGLKSEETRLAMTANEWNALAALLGDLNKEENINSAYLELFRLFRNSCAGCESNQKLIVETLGLVDLIIAAYERVLNDVTNETVLTLKCSLQFFANFVSGQSVAAFAAKHVLFEKIGLSNFCNLMKKSKEHKIQPIVSMIIFNCLICEQVKKSLSSNLFGLTPLFELLLSNIASEEADEFSLWSIHQILTLEGLLNVVYFKLETKSRLALLDVIHELLVELNAKPLPNSDRQLPIENLQYLLGLLSRNLLNIVKINPNNGENEDGCTPLEIRKLLANACEASSMTNGFSAAVSAEPELLESTIDTLKALHLLGKTDNPEFKDIGTLKLKEEFKGQNIEQSPVYAFKKDLIRLLGNLAYRSNVNQDKIRLLDGIPLILDCSNIDDRNPFIMQWCIFAIRNLTEGNAENQEQLASFARNGILVDSPLLDELGLKLLDGIIVANK